MDHFTERMKALTNAELLEILVHAKEYSQESLDAAVAELKIRDLSENEIQRVKKELETLKTYHNPNLQSNSSQTTQHVLSIDALNPLKQGITSTEKQMRWLVLIFGWIALNRVYNHLMRLPDYINTYFITHQVYEIILWVSSPTFLLCLGLFHFWKRKRLGWVLFCVYLSYFTTHLLLYFYMDGYDFITYWNFNPFYFFYSNMTSLFVHGAGLWYLSQKQIREIYGISPHFMHRLIALSCIVSFLIIFMNDLM